MGKKILRGVDLEIPDGEIHALLGPNGSGKSVMMMTIMGYPEYEVLSGSIVFNGRNITRLPIDERARLGIGISEQHPPEIKEVKLRNLINSMPLANDLKDKRNIRLGSTIRIGRFLDRGINHGLSGGESKQAELFLLLLSNPNLLLLDEPDSGVDPEQLKLVGGMINSSLRNTPGAAPPGKGKAHRNGSPKAALISTHSAAILEYLKVDKAHLMMNGKIKCSGEPLLMMTHIVNQGYDHCISCLAPLK